jgi:hypothetical protein
LFFVKHKTPSWIDELATDIIENQFELPYKKKHYEINPKIMFRFQMSRQSNQRNRKLNPKPGGHEETIKLQKCFPIFPLESLMAS